MQHEENGEFGGFLFIDHEETLEKKNNHLQRIEIISHVSPQRNKMTN